MIFRFIPHDSDASPLSRDHWHAFLSDSIEQVHNKDWRKEKKDYMRGILGNAVKDFGGASEDVKSDIHFKGMKVNAEGPITADVAQEILWEISELNFRVELSALDHYASALPFDNRRSSVLRCFASCPGNLYAVTFEEASAGLGALDIRHRAPYFQHLYSLMKDWKGHERAGPALSQDIGMCTNGELGDFEKRVARYYTQTYYDFFGRACTLPRRPH